MAVGDGGDGIGRAWVLEDILQVIAESGRGRSLHAGRESSTSGHLKFFSDQYSGPLWTFTFKRDKGRGFKAEG